MEENLSILTNILDGFIKDYPFECGDTPKEC